MTTTTATGSPNPTSPPYPTSPPGAVGASAARHGWNRHGRRWLGIGLVVLVTLVVGVVMALTSNQARSSQALDPANPAPDGAQALASVLRQQGVDVVVVRGVAALQSARVDRSTSVVVSDVDRLTDDILPVLATVADGAERLVLASPGHGVLRGLGVDVSVTTFPAGEVPAADGCDRADVRAGERLSELDRGYRPADVAGGADDVGSGVVDGGCFVSGGAAGLLTVPDSIGRPSILAIGSARIWTNGLVDEADNGAVLLRILGRSPRLVWYVPTVEDTDGAARVLERLVPRWLVPGLWVLALTVGGVMLWRGRRLGRLVSEPLPVLVPAIETTQSRGRMYRKAGDARRAGAVLQDATARRLTHYLGLGAGTHPGVLAARVVEVTGRDPVQIAALLVRPPPDQEHLLHRFAADLAALEKEVRRT